MMAEIYYSMKLRKMNFNVNKTLNFGIYEIRKSNNGIEEGFIEEDEILCDLLSIWERELEQALKSRASIEFKLFLKEKIFLEVSDEESLTFRYHQLAYDYLVGRFKIEKDKLIGFASLKLSIEYPDANNSSQAFKVLNEKIDYYIPENTVNYNKDEWVQKIMEVYINLTDKEGAKGMFIEKLQGNEFINSHIFEVKFSEKNVSSNLDLPEELLLLIKPDSLSLYNYDREHLKTFKYNKLVNWGISSIYFVFVVPEEDELILKIYLETHHTKTIQNLIETYVNLLCGKSTNEVDMIIRQNEKKFEGLASYRDKLKY